MVVAALLGALLVLILIGFPVILAIGVATLAGILGDPNLVLAMFALKSFGTVDSFALLAMPYFILAGALMSRGGLSSQLVDFAEKLVGHMRAGLPKTTIVAAMMFSNVSGSSTADVAAVGSVMIPAMKQRGYAPGFAAAVTACAGTMGPVIPPSLTMIIYGSMTGASIAGLFMAGILPGLLIGFALIACVHALSYGGRYPQMTVRLPKAALRQVLAAGLRTWPSLLMPVIIMGGILSGVFTATESGVVACIYAVLICLFVTRTLRLADLPTILLDAGLIAAAVLGILAVAGAFAWLLAYYNFAANTIAGLTGISDNGHVVLAIMLGVMLGLTMFVESLAVLIVLIPVAMAVTSTFGFDPFHVGVLMVVATQIGAITPPVAVLLYVATGIAGTSFEQTMSHAWWLLATLVAVLCLLFALPFLSTAIPNYVLG